MKSLNVGDQIETKHAQRLGKVIKVFPDGSAGIRFNDSKSEMPDDGFFFDERLPAKLLTVVK